MTTARKSRHGMGRSAWGSPFLAPRKPRPVPPPHTNCGVPHPKNKRPCSVNVHGLAYGKHEGPHHIHTAGVNLGDLWNDAGQVWDSDPDEPIPASERGAHCRDAWGPSGLAVCTNRRCVVCRPAERGDQ